MFEAAMSWQNLTWRKEPKTFPVCVFLFRDVWSLILLSHVLDSQSWSDYEDEYVGFRICKNLKMTIYSQINPISHLISILTSLSALWKRWVSHWGNMVTSQVKYDTSFNRQFAYVLIYAYKKLVIMSSSE